MPDGLGRIGIGFLSTTGTETGVGPIACRVTDELDSFSGADQRQARHAESDRAAGRAQQARVVRNKTVSGRLGWQIPACRVMAGYSSGTCRVSSPSHGVNHCMRASCATRGGGCFCSALPKPNCLINSTLRKRLTGGGGNRTPVPRWFKDSFYAHSRSFESRVGGRRATGYRFLQPDWFLARGRSGVARRPAHWQRLAE